MTHKRGLVIFAALMIGHWAEHIVQTYQVYVQHMPRHCALGLLGMKYPWLVRSEWLHFGYALLTMVGVILLEPGFRHKIITSCGREQWQRNFGAWRAWIAAYVISIWHLLEHTLLFIQAQTHHNWFGRSEPTSLIQLVCPRIELHLFYNTLVTIPMVIAMVLYMKRGRFVFTPAECWLP